MKKLLVRLAYRLGMLPPPSQELYVSADGQLCARRWVSAPGHAPLVRPVSHFSHTGQLLTHQ